MVHEKIYADILDETTDGENELYDPDQGARIREIRITDKVANDFFMMFCRGRKYMSFRWMQSGR